MKKILLFTSILFFAFSLNTVKAQTLDAVITTTPIVCDGDFATVTAYMTQTTPGTPIQLLNYRLASPFYFSYGSTGQTTGAQQPFAGLISTCYRMLMVDSLAFITAFPTPPGPPQSELSNPTHPSIFGYLDYCVSGVPELIVTPTHATDNLCNGYCTADEKLTILGGTPPYSITINSITSVLGLGSIDTTYEDFCEGTYTATIVDVNGCETDPSPTPFVISEPSKLIPAGSIISNYNGQHISCFGGNDGSILAAVSGGTPGGAPPYEFSIDGGVIWTSNPLFINLVAGTYTITYRDGNGCDTTETITLDDPPDLSGAITVTSGGQVSCYAADDGEIEFIVNSTNTGTPGYTYSIDAGVSWQSSGVFSALPGGVTYEIIVEDVNDCQYSATIFLAEPTELIFDTVSINYNGFGVSCFGASDGQITIFGVSGGVPTYEYSIDGGASFGTQTVYSGLSAGTYAVQVKDATGCIEEKIMIITEPGAFSIAAVVTSNYSGSDVSCYSVCDGEVTVTPTNGVGTITYNMTSFLAQTGTVWNYVCGDFLYTINAADENGCPATTTITLTEPLDWVFTLDSVPETCNLANGEAGITVTGGTGTLNYLWDDPTPQQITPIATNLETGIYQVTVTDANGCTLIQNISVGEIDITLAFDSAAPCNAGNDGWAEVYPDGTPPYTYQWSDGSGIILGATTYQITGLIPGTYYVTVTDGGGGGCSVTDSVEIPAVSIVDIALDMTIPQDTLVTCWGDPSSGITVIATGGTGINTYKYYIPGVFPIPQASPTFFGLFAGTYTIFVEDFNGCTDSVDVTIMQPDSLIFTTLSQDVGCNGDSTGMAYIDTIFGGTAPYSYLWSTGETSDTIFNLIAGTYTVTATDFLGCLMIPPSNIITINEPFILQSAITVVSDATCDSSQTLATGEMSVSASGGTPGITGYSYLWNTAPPSTSTSINFLMPGMYTVEIIDSNGCTVLDSAEILTGENPTLDVLIQNVSCYDSTNGWMFTSAIGGEPPYLFSDDGGFTWQSNLTFGPTGEASYFITVIDDFGCTDADSVHVTRPELINISSLTQNVSCYDSADGELEAIVTGGTPGYSYVWINAANDTVATTQIADSLVLGSYIVTVTDDSSCIATSDSMKITQPDSLYISALTSTAVLCNGGNTGTATAVAAGGTPNYSYVWIDAATDTVATTQIADSLVLGNYLVQISDSNGCSRNSNIDVTEPDVLTTIYDMDSVSCNGGNDGSVIVLVSGGEPPYTYLWDNGSIADSAYNLAAGYHTVAITDFNLCVLIDSVEILEPVLLTIDNLIIEEISCHDANDAEITFQVTGGNFCSTCYMYSNDNGSSMQSSPAFSNLIPNTYIMYVEDNKGCIDRDTVEIINPDSLYIDTTIFHHVQCYGSDNGWIQAINAIGGTAPYMYSVNGGMHHPNMAYFYNYSPGSYTVEVFDAHNCVAQDYIIITEPSELEVTITTSNWYFNTYQIQCNGDTSGFADITANGGVPPYTYTVLDGNGATVVSSTNSHISGLEAGALTFVIMDADSCTYEETIIYTEPSPIVHTFITTNISCIGWSNGSIIDVVSGGVGTATTYSYHWNTGASTYSLSSLLPGTYTDTVVDEIGCISIDDTTIYLDDELALTVTNSVDVSCHDYCDGVIEVEASGGMPNINPNGTPVYSYQWDDVLLQTTSAAIGLCVDNISNSATFTCIVTDGQGCTATVTQDIEQEEKLIVTVEILNPIACNTGNDGKLTADITGGNGGTTYLWNNWTTWDTNPVNSNLLVNSYVVVAKDILGCMDTAEIYLSEPSALSIDTIYKTNVSCFDAADGTITAAVSGGTPIFPNFKYAYTWSNSFSEEIDISTAIGLIPGIYTVTAKDANDCEITSQSVYIIEPDTALSILVDSTDETCEENDGSATAYVLGGTFPYQYSIDGGLSSQTLNTFYNLAPDSLYTINVTDANGCAISGSTFVNGVRNIFLPGNLTSIDSTTCLGKTIFLEIEEKPGLIYVWEDSSIIADRWVTPTDPVNVYTLSITDASCANAYTVTATIYLTNPVDPLVSTNPSSETPGLPAHILPGESIEILSNNMNCDIYQWSWMADSDTTFIILASQRVITDYPEVTGRYYIAVDSAGCLGSGSIAVAVGVKPYDAFTPNDDDWNNVWKIPGITYYPNALIKVFNRWGALVHETSGGDSYVAWDGTSNGKELPVGTYYYIIDLNNGDEPQTGPITIIR